MKENTLFTPHAEALFLRQQIEWPFLADNYRALRHISVREIDVDGLPIRLQYNAARIHSTASHIDAVSIAERPCFLCDRNRPDEQLSLPIAGRYKLLINPYPIFPIHFTITSIAHVPQILDSNDGCKNDRITDMLTVAQMLPGYVVFYNGARCGASAPDHMHFQAGSCGIIPFESKWDSLVERHGKYIIRNDFALSWLTDTPMAIMAIDGKDIDVLQAILNNIMQSLPLQVNDVEPAINILCTHRNEDSWRCWVVARSAHRPSQYYAEGDAKRLISPGAVDMMGLIITPRKEDFELITTKEISDIYRQVSSPDILPSVIEKLCQ